jgi:hypothetical protein
LPKPPSLMTGRNLAPLSEEDKKRTTNTFMGLDPEAVVRFDAENRTVFRIANDPLTAEEYGEIVFGPDIYPGTNIVDPNSSLGLVAAAAHELTHLYRWRDKQAIDDESLEHIDEALTSLQAIANFGGLKPVEVRQLAADAMQRLRLHLIQLSNAKADERKSD